MNHLAGLIALALLLPLASRAATRPVESPDRDTWTLEADRDTGKFVFLQKGLTRVQVIELLGKRFSKGRNKKDPAVEIMRYSRTIIGPVTQKQVKTGNGLMFFLRHNIFYIDRIEVTLRDGVVTGVIVKRELERDPGGVPRLGNTVAPPTIALISFPLHHTNGEAGRPPCVSTG